MNKINERRLIEAIAKAHLGDAELCKKLGFDYPKECGELLKPYSESYDKDPPDELLEKVNDIFVEEFTTNCLKRLESGELDESVFEEMIKSF